MVAILLVPQAIAYAYLTGMPPEYGLYTALVPCVLYVIFGTSQHLNVGPVAVSALVVMAGVSQLAEPFSAEYIQLVITAGLFIGIVQFLLGMIKFGSLINLLSYPVITGFTSAASVIVIVNQFKDILGISVPSSKTLVEKINFIISSVEDYQYPTLLLSAISFLVIILIKRINKKIPYGLLIVAFGILASYLFNLNLIGVNIIKDVPSGLPDFASPEISFDIFKSLIPTIILGSLISIVEAVGIAKAIGGKHDYYDVDTNQELKAIGIAKIGGSFFNSIPSSGSFSRSALINEMKGRTSIASLFSVGFVILSLLFLTPVLYYLPKSILAIIIVFAVKGLFEHKLARTLYKTNKLDLLVMLLTFVITLTTSIATGILAGFILSLIMVAIGSNHSTDAIKNVLLFKGEKTINATETNGILKVTIKDQLNFSNSGCLDDIIIGHIKENKEIKTVNINFHEVSDIDSTGLSSMTNIIGRLQDLKIDFEVSQYNEKVSKRLSYLGVH